MFNPKVYKNTTELANLNGIPIYMHDMIDAALRARLNTFLQGDTGSGKTQLARDVQHYFGDKSLFVLGRNDMDVKELFQQVNPEFLKALKGQNVKGLKFKELTDRINYNFIAVDELPNCVPAVRAQLFNLFDGYIEIEGKAYPIGNGYSVGIATGNIGQQFTESSNDTLEMLVKDKNPRVNFEDDGEDKVKDIIKAHEELKAKEVPFEKYIVASYLVHGLDYLEGGRSKIGSKSAWPNNVEGHEAGSDAALILPVSPRAAKSIIMLSQALDDITKEKGADELDEFNSMMTAYKFVSAYSGVLNEALVRQDYGENNYSAMDAVVNTTKTQFDSQKSNIAAGIEMAKRGKKDKKILDEFAGRWEFMRSLLENLGERK